MERLTRHPVSVELFRVLRVVDWKCQGTVRCQGVPGSGGCYMLFQHQRKGGGRREEKAACWQGVFHAEIDTVCECPRIADTGITTFQHTALVMTGITPFHTALLMTGITTFQHTALLMHPDSPLEPNHPRGSPQRVTQPG